MEKRPAESMRVKEVSVYGNSEFGELSPRLENVSMVIAPGEWLYVVGVNGSGKSTLARLLAGLQPEGMVGVLQRGFAGDGSSPIVLQQPRAQLFGETPREEVIFALEWKGIVADIIPLLADQALSRAGLSEYADEPWDRLSGGQQQLAAIAASTAVETSFIVLDEVTSMLDEANRSLVMQRARTLHKNGTAVVWVTQRLDELEPDSRVAALAEGSVIYDGNARDFLYGAEGEPSPCERCGLRMPYMASMGLELRRLGQLQDPLPVTIEQWRMALGNDTNSTRDLRKFESTASSESLDKDSERRSGLSLLHLEGIKWHRGDEREGDLQTSGLCLLPGTITLLMGPNGAGKTSLLEKIAGLRSPEGLRITYGSDSLWQEGHLGKQRLNSEALRQYSYACQLPEEGLFARSVQEELEYSLRPFLHAENERSERLDSALSAVGWDRSWLKRDPYLMSGGERRRAALAAVFVTPAMWLLLDEPTAGLDGAGHERVALQLEKVKKDGAGILLVSHDSDWAIPLADYVLLLSVDGSLRLCCREELLAHPEYLEEAGLAIPDWLRTAHRLWQNGAPSEQIWKPADAAAEMVKAWEPVVSAGDQLEESPHHREWPMERFMKGEDTSTFPKKTPRQHRLTGFDPRSIWLSYVLISTGLFLLSNWFAIALGGAVVAGLLIAGNVSLRRWRGLIINYAVFSIVTSGLFALGAGDGSGWLYLQSFAGTLFSFVRTMLVLLLGLAIPLVMTPLSLRRSLTQMISVRGKTPQWAQRFILMITLMMRFVPVLLTLWERFTRIFLARGKSISRKPWLAIRRLKDVSLPFLLALFRLADELTLALESRGVGLHQSPTQAIRLKWRMRDYGLVVGALALGSGLWLFTNLY
ncbi:ATP-binding cassette domain-containing protein [Cohnella sp.]|uniref:ATP-binding cassette domain-containing protein n=1 Tax=Cohnella sp. TaxID=1883426 RepID=UPI003566D051